MRVLRDLIFILSALIALNVPARAEETGMKEAPLEMRPPSATMPASNLKAGYGALNPGLGGTEPGPGKMPGSTDVPPGSNNMPAPSAKPGSNDMPASSPNAGPGMSGPNSAQAPSGANPGPGMPSPSNMQAPSGTNPGPGMPTGPSGVQAQPSANPRPGMPGPGGMQNAPGANPRPGMPGPGGMQAGPDTYPGPGNRAFGRAPGVQENRPQMERARGKRPGAAVEPEVYRVVPQKCVPAKGQFIWNFEEEEIVNVLRQVSDLLCKTFVINEAISKNQKFTIIGKSPITPNDAWNILNAAMAAKGLALARQGNTYTVIKRNESKNYSTPFYSAPLQAKNNEEIGTLFYKAEHATPDALKNIARFLISKDGIVEVVGDQFIIVIDSNSNIRRLGQIIAQIDVQDALDKIHFIPLQHADAESVEKQLRELFDVSTGPGGGPRRPRAPGVGTHSSLNIRKIIADKRQNALIIETDLNSLEKVKEVVALVDQPASEQASKGKIHVYRLRYGDSKKIAETLNAVVQQGNRGRPRFGGGRRDEGTTELFEGEVKVTAHENTNTIVVVASANDYRSLLSTIKELDIRKEQVYVEAVIMDIRINDNSDFGVNAFGGLKMSIPGLGDGLVMLGNPGGKDIVKGLAGSLGSGASNLDFAGSQSVGALAVLQNFLSGGVAGLVGPTIKMGGTDTKIPSFGAVLTALSMNANVDILSTPYLLTSDNQEAVMKVGEKIPMIRGASTVGSSGLAGGTIPMQNVTYEPVELTLKITPRVGADDIINLTIEQEVNELGTEEMILNAKQYHINTKSAKTNIVLKDQQTGVIGGLISHKTNRTDTKVPFLGDIPLLGWLFKTRSNKNERKSLVLILTPYIIRDQRDYEEILKKKLREREEFAELYYGGKIKNYDRTINYDKKAGPLASTLLSVDAEMKKVENGGPGDGTETVIAPKEKAKEEKAKEKPVLEETPEETIPESEHSNEPSSFMDEPATEEIKEAPIDEKVTMFGPEAGDLPPPPPAVSPAVKLDG